MKHITMEQCFVIFLKKIKHFTTKLNIEKKTGIYWNYTGGNVQWQVYIKQQQFAFGKMGLWLPVTIVHPVVFCSHTNWDSIQAILSWRDSFQR